MIAENKSKTTKRGYKKMRAVVHKDGNCSEAMEAFSQKRATMAVGYVRDCNAAEIRFLRQELCNTGIRA